MRSPGDPRPRHLSALLFLAILLVAVGLRLRGFTESLWLDELFTSSYFCGHPLVLLRTLYTDIHPPAYFVFIHFWIRLFGDGEIALRIPPLISGLASLWLIFQLGKHYRGEATGWVAAALLAFSPVHIWYSAEARPYATNLFLLLLTAYAFVQRREDPRPRWTALFAVGLLGIVFTHYYTAAFLAVFPALALLSRAPRLRGLLLVSGGIGLLLAAYLGTKAYFSDVPTGRPYLRGLDLQETWSLCFDWFLTGKAFTPILVEEPLGETLLPALQALAVLAFGAGTWRLLRESNRRGYELLVIFAVLPGCLFAMNLLGMSKTYIERSALPALPFFFLVLASGIAGWKSRQVQRAAHGMTGVGMALILAFSVIHERDWTVYKPNPDWKRVTTFLGDEIARHEGRAASARPLQMYTSASPLPMSYYDPRIQEMKHLVRNEQKVGHLLNATQRVFGEGSLGTFIQDTLNDNFDELDRIAEATRRQVRMAVRSTKDASPLELPAGRAPGHFWLLHQFKGTPADHRILNSPRTHPVSKHEFGELTLWQLALRPRPLVQR